MEGFSAFNLALAGFEVQEINMHFLFITAIVVLCAHGALSAKSTDIYHVVTGESELPFRKNLDPVYYVGIYEERPKTMPKAVSNSSPFDNPCTT